MVSMMNEERPYAAFLISLIAGILILLGSVAMVFMMSNGFWWMDMSGGHYTMMGSFSLTSGLIYALIAFGALCGIIVLIASIMLNYRPRETTTWGTIILIFSILSFVGMGGLLRRGAHGYNWGSARTHRARLQARCQTSDLIVRMSVGC